MTGPETRIGGAPGGLDVGPMVTLPLFRLLAAAWGATAVVGFVSQGVWSWLGRLTPGVKDGIWLGAACVAVAHLVGLLALRPWSARRLGRWPFAWLVGRGASFVAVLLVAALLYSSARPEPLAFGLVIATGYFAALIAEVVAYATHIRSLPSEEPAGQAVGSQPFDGADEGRRSE